MVEIVSVVDEGLGHSSYVVGLGDGTALVVDPGRFPDRQREVAAEREWRIGWTVDTHSHADYISGSPELAADGAIFLASAGAGLDVSHRAIEGGDKTVVAPGVSMRAIATPGHTPDHLAYLLLADGVPVGLFSGGSLMVGGVGRTDLLGDERREDLARDLFRALRAEILPLPDDLPVYPTHGAGSFCSAPAGSSRTSTIGIERATNPFLGIDDEDQFVNALVSQLGSFPTYFRRLPEINRLGPRLYPAVPALTRLDGDTVRAHLAAGGAFIDARPIEAFARRHALGSISIQQRPVFASWLGWLIDLDRPLVFVLDATSDRDALVRQCLAIGHDSILGELDGGLDTWARSGLPVASIPIVGTAGISGTLLDVRQTNEWDAGHISGAVHIELGVLADETPPNGPITVMCGHGERAMTGASLLEAAGHLDLSVLIADPGDWPDTTGSDLSIA